MSVSGTEQGDYCVLKKKVMGLVLRIWNSITIVGRLRSINKTRTKFCRRVDNDKLEYFGNNPLVEIETRSPRLIVR